MAKGVSDWATGSLGTEMPPIPGPAGNYVQYVQTGNLMFLSGAGPRGAEEGYVIVRQDDPRQAGAMRGYDLHLLDLVAVQPDNTGAAGDTAGAVVVKVG